MSEWEGRGDAILNRVAVLENVALPANPVPASFAELLKYDESLVWSVRECEYV